MTDIFEKVKDQVKIADAVEAFGVKLNSRDKGLCPFHHEKTPSFSVDRKNNIFTCFGCGETGDVITFASKIKEVEPLEAAKLLAEMFHIDVGEEERKPSKTVSIAEYIKRCIADIDKTDYFEKRGLSKATIRKFCLGYDDYRTAVVIPYSSKLTYYQTRSTIEKSFFKPKTEDAGPEPIFNIHGLKLKTKEPIFVVESPICAMSISQSGGNAIATCGTGGWKKVVDEVKKQKPIGGFILCFDNDEPGQKASRLLFDELTSIGVKVIEYNLAKGCKDPNELLMTKQKELEESVKAAKMALRKRYATAKDSFDALELQGANIEPPSWIVNDVLPTGLAILCAPSKIGKSWMMMQLGIAVAEGNDFLDFKTNQCGVLYYALEDSKARLKDRMNKILKGKKAPSDLRFVTSADTVDNGLLQKIDEELKTFPGIKLVIIDTLQKVRGKAIKNETLYGGDYREMGQMKEYADNHRICFLFVHHLRKMQDEGDVFNMISGSTAIMGAADTIFVISKKKRADENAELSMTGRDISQSDLVIAFSKVDYKWVVEGTAEEVAYRKEREEYEGSPIVQAIKELVKRNPMTGWCGTIDDLKKEVFDITGKTICDSNAAIGKTIERYEYRLHCDSIDHKATRTSKTRKHIFTKILPKMPYYYQGTLYDSSDNED